MAFHYPVVQKDGRGGTTDVKLTIFSLECLDGRGNINHIVNAQGGAVNGTYIISRVSEAFWRA